MSLSETSETLVSTFVDGKCTQWRLAGELHASRQEEVSRAQQLVFDRVGREGYVIVAIPLGLRDTVREYICEAVFEITGKRLDDIGSYHTVVDEQDHLKVVQAFRETRLANFGDRADEWVRELARETGLSLSSSIDKISRDHVQIRTVRPGSNDFNPPHKDSYLAVYHDVMNFWIPLNYLRHDAIMPLCPGSHLWDEREIVRTAASGARIGNYVYTVPAVVAYQTKPLQMIRPRLGKNDALAFTPYLIHGLGANETADTRFALELRLQVTVP